MTAAQLLRALGELGATIEVVNGRLVIDAPSGTLSPELRAALAAHKRTILDQLGATDPDVAERTAAMRERHPRPWSVVPTLTARDVSRGAGGCLSCGEPVADHPGGMVARCGPCVRATHRLLADGG